MTAVCLLLLLPATAAAGYYVLLTLIGLKARRRSMSAAPVHTFTVLIPAHDEEAGLPRTLRSVASADYPPELLRVLVVADNCTDRTAQVAGDHGAGVLVREDSEHRGKGYALAFGMERLLDPTDAVFVLDADCEVSPGLFRRLDQHLTGGAEVVQARVRSRNAAVGPTGYLAAVGAEVDHAVAVGLDRLGCGVPLRGTGMLFARRVLERLPWATTGLAEDAEYAAGLHRAGVRVRLADEAVLCDAPNTAGGLSAQRRRWRAALRVPGGWVSRLFTSKPLVLIQLAVAAVAVTVAGDWVLAVWLAVLLAGTGWVYLRAVRRVGRTPGRWRWVWVLPALVAWLGWIALEGLWKREKGWRRTERPTRRPKA